MESKQCNECRDIKINSLHFSKLKKSDDGFYPICKLCVNKEIYQKNKEKIKLRAKTWYQNNSQKVMENNRIRLKSKPGYEANYARERRKKCSEKIANTVAKYRDKNRQTIYRKNQERRKLHPEKVNALTAKRRFSKKNATPLWLTEFDLDYIKNVYLQARFLQSLDGIKRCVDHIIPLKNDIVCGLHVPWNLQVLTKPENSRKHNKIIV